MSSKKKILIRIGSLRHGGAEKVLATFLKNLPKDKYEIDLLLNLRFGKYLSEIPSWITILHLNKGEMITTNRIQDIPKKIYRKLYQGFLRKFPKVMYTTILKNKKYDVEIVANHALIGEMLNSPLKASKKIVWVHSDVFNNTEKKPKDFYKEYFRVDKILAISESIYNSFIDVAKDDEQIRKVERIHNPIDTQEILTKFAEREPENIGIDTSVKTFIAIGTVYPAKGFDRLLRAHKRLIEEGVKHNIVIVGDGYDFHNLQKLQQELKLEESVKLLGFKENPYPYFKLADAFVLSSRYEGYPTVLYEAMVLKKEILATRVSGVEEILEEGKLGKIIESTEEAVYQGLKESIQNPAQGKAYIQNIENTKLPIVLEDTVGRLMDIIDRV